MGFLGVYRASYDYVPQGESELAITAGDILYVLEKSGEDGWWKAKKKASGEDDDEPVGLIPNNYVEEAHPSHHARALYDYARQTDEELSFSEDSRLEVFDTSDPDWILVGVDGEYGFAPANYIELQDEDASASEPPPPSLPRRPAAQVEEDDKPSEYVQPGSQGPAAALAGVLTQRNASIPSSRAPPPQFTPEASDDDEPPPSLPTRPQSIQVPDRESSPSMRSATSPIARGIAASPPHNRISMARTMDIEPAHYSPGGFHMYNINEMVSVMDKRKKMPTTLGINNATGVISIAPEKVRDGPEQKWTAEKMTHYSIEGKHVFLELVRPSKSVDFHAGAKDTAEEIVAALGELSGAIRAEGLREIFAAGAGGVKKTGQVLYDFMAQGEDEVTVAVGDEVIILDDTKSEEWWQVRRIKNGKEGVVPSSYVEITGVTAASSSTGGVNAGKSTIEQTRLEEQRLAKESLKAARREEDTRGSEVGPGDVPVRASSLPSSRESSNSHVQQKSRRESGRNESTSSKPSKSKPDVTKVRTWTDRSKSFSVEAQFLALKDGKINLHKMNGVKIAVPVVKMSVEDLEYVERITGISLDEDKPLSDVKKRRSRQDASSSRDSAPAGATIEHKQPEYDWFQFFLSCEVAVGLCERYAQVFQKDSMDESVLPDVDAPVLRNLGIREGDIIKIMRFLDKKYARTGGGKRNVSFGGEEAKGETSGSLFSGPGGTLRNNTRKGRPAPVVQTNDIVDAKAFSQEARDSGSSRPERVATPLASEPTPVQKDVVRGGFDDDAWDVKPSKSTPTSNQPSQQTPAPAPAPQQPALTGSMQDLSLLTQPLEPIRAQPTAPAPQAQTPANQKPQPPQQQAHQGATPSFFQGIGQQQTGLPQQQAGASNQFNPQINLPQNIARQRPTPPQYQNFQGGLMIPAPPNRPLSAPQANQNSGFAPPPIQPQSTGMQNSSAFQSQVAPPGQSLDELRMSQQFTGVNSAQNGQQNMAIVPQPTGFQYNGMQHNNQPQNSFQYPMQTGMQQQPQFMSNGSGPFPDPRSQQFSPIQQNPTGFQGSFGQPQQQFPPTTGVNSFLPPALQPTPTGMQRQNNGYTSFNPPHVPPMLQQSIPAPLISQKTGPPPPVRFGVSGDIKKLMPQATGRRANLAQATPQNPFGF